MRSHKRLRNYKNMAKKYKLKQLKLSSFKNFADLTYNVRSGRIFGRGSEGKTNLLSAISAMLVKKDLFGAKTNPLSKSVNACWVKAEWDIDGEKITSYRAWNRSFPDISTSGSVPNFDDRFFLYIFNPLFVFERSREELVDLLIETAYCRSDMLISYELPEDVGDVSKQIGQKISLSHTSKLKEIVEYCKWSLKSLMAEKQKIEKRIDQLRQSSDNTVFVNELENNLKKVSSNIEEERAKIGAVTEIKSCLLKSAVEKLNPTMILTRFDDCANITYNDRPLEQLSSSEKLSCGLDISNMIALAIDGNIPPTVIDNAAIYDLKNIDTELYQGLSQIITASYADVELCEYNPPYLTAMDQSWKKSTNADFQMEVFLRGIPYE